jgi:hypothetical protein
MQQNKIDPEDSPMTEAEVVKTLREHFEGLFPKVCPNCKRCYTTLREYILITKRLGQSMSYDAELGNWHTSQPIGGPSRCLIVLAAPLWPLALKACRFPCDC